MGKLLLRLLFKFAKKFALKGFEAFLAEYARGKFDNLNNPPLFPELEAPELPSFDFDADETITDKKDEIKDTVITRATEITAAAVILASSGDNVSSSEIVTAKRDLDGATEDWNPDILPVMAAAGMGVKNIVDNLETPEIEMPKLDYDSLPRFDLNPLPEYIPVSRSVTGGVVRPSTEKPSATLKAKPSGNAANELPKRKTKPKKTKSSPPPLPSHNKFGVVSKRGGSTFKYKGKKWTTDTVSVGESMNFMSGYQYDPNKQTVGSRSGFGGFSSAPRKIKELIIHCTADPEGTERTVEYLNNEHRGQGWIGVGYNFVVHLDGTVESARPLDMIGAHCDGHNAISIGIAYIGGLDKKGKAKDTRTLAQRQQIWNLVFYLLGYFPSATVHGHREFANKACPCFNVQKEFAQIKSGETTPKPRTGVIASSSQYIDDTGVQRVSDRNVVQNNDG